MNYTRQVFDMLLYLIFASVFLLVAVLFVILGVRLSSLFLIIVAGISAIVAIAQLTKYLKARKHEKMRKELYDDTRLF